MIGYIRDNQWIYLDQVTQGVEECLVSYFSVRHPRSYYIDTRSNWDGWYRRYSVSKQRLALPFLLGLKDCCKENNIPLEISDERDAPKFPIPNKDQITNSFIEGITLDDHQVKALHASCDNEIGLFDMTTGAGKTEIMCGIVKMYRCPTLIITDQIVVLEQIVGRLQMRNVVHNDDIGKFCHGERPDGNIVMVGSIQSINSPTKKSLRPKKPTKAQVVREGIRLAKNKELPGVFPDELIQALYKNPNSIKKLDGKYLDILTLCVSDIYYENNKNWYKVRKRNSESLQEMARKCDLLMVDECDKAAGPGYDQLFKKIFKGRRRYGFSGTPFDNAKPVEDLFLRERLGSIICKADRKQLTSIGRIIPIKYFMVGFEADGDKYDSTTLDIAERETLIESEKFHKAIGKIVNLYKDDSTLILVDTLAIKELGASLEEIIPNSRFIHGGTTKKVRRECIEQFENKEFNCLIGSKILKRGLDLKGGVDNLIICGGGKLASNFDQMVGRAVRKNNKGYARVFDFLFLNNKYLYRHSRSRLRTAVEMGYPTKVIVNGHEINGEKFVKSRFRIPKAR